MFVVVAKQKTMASRPHMLPPPSEKRHCVFQLEHLLILAVPPIILAVLEHQVERALCVVGVCWPLCWWFSTLGTLNHTSSGSTPADTIKSYTCNSDSMSPHSPCIAIIDRYSAAVPLRIRGLLYAFSNARIARCRRSSRSSSAMR